MATQALDFYEFLQISPNADFDTIHRVYKFLAARFHPDNPDSGDPEKFFLLKTAYDVLADPAQRARYDAECAANAPARQPMSNTVDFMDTLEGELNRRLAVLAVLYYQRRTSPYHPEVSLADIEKRMGFPRDYLDFTTWYLTKKNYVTKADNSDFALTAEGVDFVETQRITIPVLNKLLTSGAEAAVSAAAQASISSLDENAAIVPPPPTAEASGIAETNETAARTTEAESIESFAPAALSITEAEAGAGTTAAAEGPAAKPLEPIPLGPPAIPGLNSINLSAIAPLTVSTSPFNAEKLVMVGKALFKDRRTTGKERRTGAPDWRANKADRRHANRDRRAAS